MRKTINTATRIGIAAISIVILLTVGGCLSRRPPLQLVESEKPLKIVRAEGITLTARFLDDETLEAKFGERDKGNPFLTEYTSFQLRRFVVFDLSIKNTSDHPVMFQLNRLEMQFGGKSLFAYNEFRINQYWDFKEGDNNVKAIYKARRERFVRENVLPDSVTIPSPGELKGYAVFTGNTPEYGTATIFVPLLGSDGRPVHRFEVSFEF